MNELKVDDRFSNALRAELTAKVQKALPARARRRMRMWLGAGALAGAGILGGMGAASAGWFEVVAGEKVAPVAAPVTESHTGTANVDLGRPPEGATGIRFELTCLTVGSFDISEGGSVSCTEADVGTPQAVSGGAIRIGSGQTSVIVTTQPATRWRMTAGYVNQAITIWGVNAKGETYGFGNAKGVPDLVAVVATNGREGFVYRSDLEDADGTAAIKTFKSPAEALAWQEARRGKTIAIPVYDAQAESVVGEFVIGYSGFKVPK